MTESVRSLTCRAFIIINSVTLRVGKAPELLSGFYTGLRTLVRQSAVLLLTRNSGTAFIKWLLLRSHRATATVPPAL